jgi:hypothetical protein
MELTRLELDRLYRRMIALADAQKTVTDAELVEMVNALRAAEREPSTPAVVGAPQHGRDEVGYGHGV